MESTASLGAIQWHLWDPSSIPYFHSRDSYNILCAGGERMVTQDLHGKPLRESFKTACSSWHVTPPRTSGVVLDGLETEKVKTLLFFSLPA